MSRSQDVYNTLPSSDDAEKAVLSCLIQFPGKSIDLFQEMVSVDMLHNPGHRTLCEAILGLWNSSGAVDPILLLGRLQEARTLDSVGGPSYISQVQFLLPSAANLKQYLEIIRSCYHKRALIRAAELLADAPYKGEEEIAAAIPEVEKAILAYRDNKVQEESGLTNSGWFEVADNLETRYDLFRQGKIQGIPTGLPTFDRITGGLQKGVLYVVGAPPNIGKSLLTSQFVVSAADYGIKSAVFALEMSGRMYRERMLPQSFAAGSGEVKSGLFREGSLEKITTTMGKLRDKVFIDDSAVITVQTMITKLKRLFAKHPDIGLVAIDYLQLICPTPGAKRQSNRETEVNELVRGVDSIKKLFNVPVVLITSLNRKSTERKDQRPRLSDSRDSGQIEFQADVGILLHLTDREKGSIIIDKHRDGEIRDIDVVFNKQWLRFEEA